MYRLHTVLPERYPAPRMEVRLVIDKGRTPKRHVILRNAETLVGRQQGANLRIVSAQVSRRHCLLLMERGLFYVEDLGSANGTFLNGEPVDGRAVVRPGDRLEIGPLHFVVEYELTQAAVDRLRKKSRSRPDEEEEDFETLPEAEELLEEAPEVDVEPVEVAGAGDSYGLGIEDDDNQEEIPEVVLDLDEPWDMPAENDMRDILTGLDDSTPPEEDDRKKKRR